MIPCLFPALFCPRLGSPYPPLSAPIPLSCFLSPSPFSPFPPPPFSSFLLGGGGERERGLSLSLFPPLPLPRRLMFYVVRVNFRKFLVLDCCFQIAGGMESFVEFDLTRNGGRVELCISFLLLTLFFIFLSPILSLSHRSLRVFFQKIFFISHFLLSFYLLFLPPTLYLSPFYLPSLHAFLLPFICFYLSLIFL